MQEHSAVFLIILMCEDIIANRREKFNKMGITVQLAPFAKSH